jgi:hypothetical protein
LPYNAGSGGPGVGKALLDHIRNNPEAWGGIAGMLGGGALGYFFAPETKRGDKRKGWWKNMLTGAGIGAGVGAASGAAFRHWIDPRSLTAAEREALKGFRRLDRDDWRELYRQNVKDPKALAAFEANIDDPNHPANRMYDILAEHAKNPDVSDGAYADLPRSAIKWDRERGRDQSYLSPDRSERWRQILHNLVDGQSPKWSEPEWQGFTHQDLRDLGFLQSAVAVPEAHQKEWMTWRHPDHNAHVHLHPNRWFTHVDEHPSSQMLKYRLERATGEGLSAKQLLRAAVYGAPHAILEGVPGWGKAGWSWLTDAPGLDQRYEAATGSETQTPHSRPGVIATRAAIAGSVPATAALGYLLKKKWDKEVDEDKELERARRNENRNRRRGSMLSRLKRDFPQIYAQISQPKRRALA